MCYVRAQWRSGERRSRSGSNWLASDRNKPTRKSLQTALDKRARARNQVKPVSPSSDLSLALTGLPEFVITQPSEQQ